MDADRTQRCSPAALWLAMRPSQWTKNTVVLAAFFFGFWDPSQSLDLRAGLSLVLPAALLFCLVSSGVYLLNDVRDLEADRRHPAKRHRPIASGRVPVPAAVAAGIALLAFGAAAAWLLSPPFAAVIGSYVLIQVMYSAGLKRIALLDILVIAAGFVLRALAGAVVLDVVISPWLLLCTFLLALFLALCKRRHEKQQTADHGNGSRASLARYDRRLLDQLIAIVSASTLVSYSIYTLAPDTVAKFDTHGLGFTIPFVLFGIFRYLDLVYRHAKGEQPEKILLTDLPLLVTIALYGVAVLAVFMLTG
jgi:4-hydroxybenzoate polyprenyltransferase